MSRPKPGPRRARPNCPECMLLTDDDGCDWRIPCVLHQGHDGWHQDIAGLEWMLEEGWDRDA